MKEMISLLKKPLKICETSKMLLRPLEGRQSGQPILE